MKAFINLIVLTALAAAGASADIIVGFDNPNQTGSPGQTLQFFGTIANTNPSDTNRVYLNGDSFNFALNGASYTLSDQFGNTPVFLDAGGSSGDIELFDLTLSISPGDPFGIYRGQYGLLGGMDGGDMSAQDNLVQAGFSVETVPPDAPEPATFAMLGTGLALSGWLYLASLRRAAGFATRAFP